MVDSIRETTPTVQALHELLMSDKMYGNMEVYDRWCRAMESGVLRGTYKKNNTPQRLEDSISPWHEAHFRLATSISIHTPNLQTFNSATICVVLKFGLYCPAKTRGIF